MLLYKNTKYRCFFGKQSKYIIYRIESLYINCYDFLTSQLSYNSPQVIVRTPIYSDEANDN